VAKNSPSCQVPPALCCAVLCCAVLCCAVLCDAQCMTYAGTVTYMSPERLENKPYNFAADIW